MPVCSCFEVEQHNLSSKKRWSLVLQSFCQKLDSTCFLHSGFETQLEKFFSKQNIELLGPALSNLFSVHQGKSSNREPLNSNK